MINTELFQSFSRAIRQGDSVGFSGFPLPEDLLMRNESNISMYYAPFDYVNPDARLVIVGITPGLRQAKSALMCAASAMAQGASIKDVLVTAKSAASFGGPMRNHLVSMMDNIGLNDLLGLQTTALLFGGASHLAQFTSVLRYPVFVGGKNYNGTPNVFSTHFLRDNLSYFLSEIPLLKNSIFLPVGKIPADVLRSVVETELLSESNVLFGLPHPSPNNIERITYFLGKKSRHSLSCKTNASIIDAARNSISEKLCGYRRQQRRTL